MSTASPPSASLDPHSSVDSSPSTTPPFPAYLTGRRVLLWDLPAAQVLRQRHRVVGECRAAAVQPARKSVGEQRAVEEDVDDTAAAYLSVPVHYSLYQANWLLRQGAASPHAGQAAFTAPSMLSAAGNSLASRQLCLSVRSSCQVSSCCWMGRTYLRCVRRASLAPMTAIAKMHALHR